MSRALARLGRVAVVGALAAGLVAAGTSMAAAASKSTPSGWRYPAFAVKDNGFGTGFTPQQQADLALWWNGFAGASVPGGAPGTAGPMTPAPARFPTSNLPATNGAVIQGQVISSTVAKAPTSGRFGAGAARLGGLVSKAGAPLAAASVGFSVTNTAMQLVGVDPADTGTAGVEQILDIRPDSTYTPNIDAGAVPAQVQPGSVAVRMAYLRQDGLTDVTLVAQGRATQTVTDAGAGDGSTRVELNVPTAAVPSCANYSDRCTAQVDWDGAAIGTDGKRYDGGPREGNPSGDLGTVSQGDLFNLTGAAVRGLVFLPRGVAVDHWLIRPRQATALYLSEPGTSVVTVDVDAPDARPDPERTWRTTWTCGGQPAGPLDSPTFRESDETWPALPMGTCPDSAPLDSALVQQITLDGSLEPFTVLEWDGPSAGLAELRERFPECMDGTCTVVLSRVFPDGKTQSCFDNPAACSSWFTDPDRETKYVCSYSGQNLPLADCAMYAPTFDAGKTDAGVYYADPATGTEPTTGVDGQPNPSPGTATTPSTDTPTTPGTGGGTSPETDGNVITRALADAFVPSASSVQAIRASGAKFGQVTPIPEITSVVAWLKPPDGLTSRCWVLTLRFPEAVARAYIPTTIPVLDTCDAQDPIVQAIVQLRPLLAVVVWVAPLAPLAWWAWREYAPGAKGVA